MRYPVAPRARLALKIRGFRILFNGPLTIHCKPITKRMKVNIIGGCQLPRSGLQVPIFRIDRDIGGGFGAVQFFTDFV